MREFGSIDQFREAATKMGTDEIGEFSIRQSFDTEIKAGEGRRMTFTISTASVDRMGDTIAVDGWKTDAYVKNPVVLWGHDSSSLPVAKATKVWKDNGALKAEAEFTPLGMARFNDTVYDMLKGGFLNATSVGFQPLKYAFTDDPQRRFGIDFMEQELLEFSIVSIPANSEALVSARSAGLDVEPMIDWHIEQLNKAGAGAKVEEFTSKLANKLGMALITRERLISFERSARNKRLAERRARDLELVRIKAF